MSNNKILSLLIRLGLTDPEGFDAVGVCRDRSDVEAVRCRRSGAIFLRDTRHATLSYYAVKDLAADEVYLDGSLVRPPMLDDAHRRKETFGHLVQGRDWLDVGAGDGGILEVMGPLATSAVGIEPNARMRAWAAERGLKVAASVDELGDSHFDVITLFHVFEHLPDPVADLRRLRTLLRPGGRLVIEVPHAGDALLTLYDCEAFRRFTLWSEHLILHTRRTLAAFISEAGFSSVAVKGIQRYSAANHLYWLRHQQPGGHSAWAVLEDHGLGEAYAATLQSLDMTDTLVAIAQTSLTQTG